MAPAAAQDSTAVTVEVRGVSADLERNVLAVMRLARAAEEAKLPRGRLERLYNRSESDIRLAMEPFGYYQPEIESALERNGTGMIARFFIAPGPAVTVRSVNVSITGPGKDAPAFRAALAAFPLKQGDTLMHLRYEAGKLALLGVASDSGYLDAKFDTAAVLVDRGAASADIVVRFETGPRFKFGAVRFDQEILDERLLRRWVPFRQGDPWQQHRLLELQTALAEAPYFARVDVQPVRAEAKDLEVPIKIELEARRPRAYEFGLGYGTDTGPRGRGAATWRWINRRGHHGNAELTLSPVQQLATAQYVVPGFFHRTGSLTFHGGYARLDPITSSSRVATVSARLARQRLGFQETISLSYQHETFNVGVDTGTASLLIGGIGFERSRSNSRVFITRGIRTRVNAQATPGSIVGTTAFLRLDAGTKVVFGLGPGFRVLARADLGRIVTNDFGLLPPTLRFFTGGDQSVRGFDYLSLGATDSLGNVIGGRALVVGSLELDFRVMPRWVVAGFTDFGQAGNSLSLTGLEQSVGAGIRFVAPVGMIRLDLAKSITGSQPIRLHVSIGPDI